MGENLMRWHLCRKFVAFLNQSFIGEAEVSAYSPSKSASSAEGKS